MGDKDCPECYVKTEPKDLPNEPTSSNNASRTLKAEVFCCDFDIPKFPNSVSYRPSVVPSKQKARVDSCCGSGGCCSADKETKDITVTEVTLQEEEKNEVDSCEESCCEKEDSNEVELGQALIGLDSKQEDQDSCKDSCCGVKQPKEADACAEESSKCCGEDSIKDQKEDGDSVSCEESCCDEPINEKEEKVELEIVERADTCCSKGACEKIQQAPQAKPEPPKECCSSDKCADAKVQEEDSCEDSCCEKTAEESSKEAGCCSNGRCEAEKVDEEDSCEDSCCEKPLKEEVKQAECCSSGKCNADLEKEEESCEDSCCEKPAVQVATKSNCCSSGQCEDKEELTEDSCEDSCCEKPAPKASLAKSNGKSEHKLDDSSEDSCKDACCEKTTNCCSEQNDAPSATGKKFCCDICNQPTEGSCCKSACCTETCCLITFEFNDQRIDVKLSFSPEAASLNPLARLKNLFTRPASYTARVDENPAKSPEIAVEMGSMAEVRSFGIGGMTCSGCATLIEKHLMKKPGVHQVKISFLTKKAEVSFYKDKISETQIRSEINLAGFSAELLQMSGGPARCRVSVQDPSGSVLKNAEEKLKVLNLLNKTAGVNRADFDDENLLVIEYDADTTGIRTCMEAVQDSLGYIFNIPKNVGKKKDIEREKWFRYVVMSFIAAIPLIFTTFILPSIKSVQGGLEDPMSTSFNLSPQVLIGFLLATPIQVIVGGSLYYGAYSSLRYGHMANMDCLIVLSTTTAYLFSLITTLIAIIRNEGEPEVFFETSAFILALIALGRYLEIVAKGRASNILNDLMTLQVPTATLYNSKTGECREIDIDFVQKNDMLKVMPGCKIPIDGIIVEGMTEVDESMVTGESRLVYKSPNSTLIGGSINQSGLIYMQVSAILGDSMISKIARLVEDAQTSKTNIERLADKIASYFVPFVIGVAAATAIAWVLVFRFSDFAVDGSSGLDLTTVRYSIFFGITVLIISCPCAVALSAPTPVLIGSGIAAKLGIVVKGGAVLEKAHKTNTVVFDKTGTLTEGRPSVIHFEISELHRSSFTEETFFGLVASAESGSIHAIAKSIVSYSAEKFPLQVVHEPRKFKASPKGYGISCSIKKDRVQIGNLAYMKEIKAIVDDQVKIKADSWEKEGKTVVFCCINGTFLGVIALEDSLKKDAQFVISELQRKNVQIWILSGDNAPTTRNLGAKVGLAPEFCLGSLLPGDKAEKVRELQEMGRIVCMIGDGVNDSAALVRADVGVAISEGTDIAIESADIVLTKKSLKDLLIMFDLSHATFKHIRYNLIWAFGYNLVGIPIASGLFYPLHEIAIPPAVAGVSELLSSIPVIIFSLLLKRYKPPVM